MKYPKLPFELNRNRKYSDKDRLNAIKLFKQGKTMLSISKLLNMSYGSVQRSVKPDLVKQYDRNKWLKNKTNSNYMKALKERHVKNMRLQKALYSPLREWSVNYVRLWRSKNK